MQTIIILLIVTFSQQLQLVGFHWTTSLLDSSECSSRSQQHNSLEGFSGSFDFKILQLFSMSFGTVSSEPTAVGIIVPLMFHRVGLFLKSSCKVRVLVYLFVFFYFHSGICWNVGIYWTAFFFLFFNAGSGLMAIIFYGGARGVMVIVV